MNKFLSPRLAAGVLALSAAASHAAVDAGITTALDGIKADGATIGGAVLVVIIAIAAFKFLRKAI